MTGPVQVPPAGCGHRNGAAALLTGVQASEAHETGLDPYARRFQGGIQQLQHRLQLGLPAMVEGQQGMIQGRAVRQLSAAHQPGPDPATLE